VLAEFCEAKEGKTTTKKRDGHSHTGAREPNRGVAHFFLFSNWLLTCVVNRGCLSHSDSNYLTTSQPVNLSRSTIFLHILNFCQHFYTHFDRLSRGNRTSLVPVHFTLSPTIYALWALP
jgi:hypothetical protein